MKVIKCENQPRINFESLMNHNKYGHTIFGDTKRLQAESGKIFSRLNDIWGWGYKSRLISAPTASWVPKASRQPFKVSFYLID